MRFNTFFFDLDDTLYPSSSNLWQEIRIRINSYMHEKLGFEKHEIEALRERYFREYGTTLRGLQANHHVDMDDYLAYVHDIPLENYLHPDPELCRSIEELPGQKFIFTNADNAHAERVTRALGVDGIFDGCIDVHMISPYCKPMPESFQLALRAAGEPQKRLCVLLDDQPRITRAARALGIFTVLVGRQDPGFDADEAIMHPADLPALLNGRI